MKRHIEYLKYLLRHKWGVFRAGLRIGVPIWQLIIHDWDKFLPDEWFGYARYVYAPDGTKYPRQSKDFRYLPTDSPAFDHAYWLHMKRNKHHWQWWIVAHENGEQIEPMSDSAQAEMLADWYGAGQTLEREKVRDWYLRNRNGMRLHPDTRRFVEVMLYVLPIAEGIAALRSNEGDGDAKETTR